MTATDYLVWGVVVHLIADWIFQNDWMAVNKVSLRHPASWAHGYIHFWFSASVFTFFWALVIALMHMAIDTRKPLAWWRGYYGHTTDAANPLSLHVAIWMDQVAHVLVIAGVALIVGK